MNFITFKSSYHTWSGHNICRIVDTGTFLGEIDCWIVLCDSLQGLRAQHIWSISAAEGAAFIFFFLQMTYDLHLHSYTYIHYSLKTDALVGTKFSEHGCNGPCFNSLGRIKSFHFPMQYDNTLLRMVADKHSQMGPEGPIFMWLVIQKRWENKRLFWGSWNVSLHADRLLSFLLWPNLPRRIVSQP